MKMKIFHVSAFTVVLTILSSIQFSYQATDPSSDSARFQTTKSGRQLHDNFYKTIDSRIPVEDALNQALTWDVEAQYEHFELLGEHIKRNDEYAEYCKEVVDKAQDLLDVTLIKLQIDDKIDIRDYVKGLYDFEKGRPISEEMENVVSRINEYRNAVVKKLEAEQARARAEAKANAQQPEAEANNQEADQANIEETDHFEAQDGDDAEVQDYDEFEINQPISAASQSI